MNDPAYEAPALAKLSMEVKSAEANTLQLTMNRSARATVALPGGTEWQAIELLPMEFVIDSSLWSSDFGEAKEHRLSSVPSLEWSGAAPEFRNLHRAAATHPTRLYPDQSSSSARPMPSCR